MRGKPDYQEWAENHFYAQGRNWVPESVADELRAEIDRLRIELHRVVEGRRGQRERAERAEVEIERLRRQIIAIREAAIKHGVNDQVGAALAYAEIVAGTKGNREQGDEVERLRKIERAARAAVETQKATGDVRLTLLADVLDDD